MKHRVIVFLLFIQMLSSYSVFAEQQWVEVTPAMRGIVITGFTRAEAKMPLATEVEGTVSEIFADVGESIPQSRRFACLDSTFAKIDIKSVESEMSDHYIDIKFYKKQVARYSKLVKKQTSSVNVLDGFSRDLDKARQALSSATLRKKRLEEHKRRHCIEADAGWLVIDRKIEKGQWLREGEIVAHVGNYSQLKVPVSLSQQELIALKREKKNLKLVFRELNLKVPARIEHISPAFDEETRKILVDLLIEDKPPELRGGMRVELILKVPDSKASAFSISKQALEERFEEYFLHRQDGKSIRIKLIRDHGDGFVTILSNEVKESDKFKLFEK